jgi:WhiB family redox-sensing transcriptional regulator
MRWRALAACKGQTAKMFPEPDDEAGIVAAKAVCEGCPVRALCLADALDMGEEDGVWGGMTGPERFELLAQAILDPETEPEIVTALAPTSLEPPTAEAYIEFYGLAATDLDDPGLEY